MSCSNLGAWQAGQEPLSLYQVERKVTKGSKQLRGLNPDIVIPGQQTDMGTGGVGVAGGRGEVEKYEHLLGSSLSSSIKIRRPTFPFPGSLVPDPYAAPEIHLGFFLLRWGQAPRQVGTGEESCA